MRKPFSKAGRLSPALLLSATLLSGLAACSGTRLAEAPSADLGVQLRARDWLRGAREAEVPFRVPYGTEIDTIRFAPGLVEIEFTPELARYAFRPESVARLEAGILQSVLPFLEGRDLRLYAMGVPLRELVPNLYRGTSVPVDSSRLSRDADRPRPLVTNIDRATQPTAGLQHRYVALWHSHGWYYDHGEKRWMWQRPRVFQTVEDLLPLSFTLPYLGPMLENAGARVFFARERDPQRNLVVIDNDDATTPGRLVISDSSAWTPGEGTGFRTGRPPYPGGFNPFRSGTYLRSRSTSGSPSYITWVPEIPEAGSYAVYVSYASLDDSIEDAEYAVTHLGGVTRFRVNQRIGGGTWIYLGTFQFARGMDPARSGVRLSTRSATSGGTVTADAVRFGGGMGLVSRDGRTGGRPRFMEGARYHLQYSGMPDSLVFDLNDGENDYRDDYQSRGEWVNYLNGAPSGPNRDRQAEGLGIPIDVSLAFHTDAGVTGPDSTIGTLSIYAVEGADSTRAFPDGVSRFANRDLADIVQTEIVRDLRVLYDSTWNRRSLYDGQYSEAFRPNVPSMLLELLSHQNFWDMRYALDPRFRFDASRAIYKGILKFVSRFYGYDYVVQPLPVTHFQATFEGADAAVLRWMPTPDPLEETATPDHYVVYTRVDSSGFDNGRRVSGTSVRLDGLESGRIYSFRVTAANAGGESFPSEVLSVYRDSTGTEPVLIVNGFDRVGPPASLVAGNLTGFAHFWDQGVPDRRDLGFVGYQFAFDGSSGWKDDDAPGHGASHGDFETRIVAGNTLDFVYVHGDALRAAGYSFDSSSDEAFEEGMIEPGRYPVVDLILGEERTTQRHRAGAPPEFTAFPSGMRRRITELARSGGGLLVSGAYVGTDLFNAVHDSIGHKTFADSVLHIEWATNHAARLGGLHVVDSVFATPGARLRFNTDLNDSIYAVESPDGLRPVGDGATLLIRYDENNLGAGVGYRGSYRAVTLGFPLETVPEAGDRRWLMTRIMEYLDPR